MCSDIEWFLQAHAIVSWHIHSERSEVLATDLEDRCDCSAENAGELESVQTRAGGQDAAERAVWRERVVQLQMQTE